MKVICISAKAQHGKDTAAAILKEYFEANGKKVLITHYADLLKFICKAYFNWDGIKDESGRSLLQTVGTDTIGKQKPTFWVDFIIQILTFFKDEWDIVLIPDCRFPCEVEEMKKHFDTYLLRVERPNFDNGLSAKQKQHLSEIALDDYEYDALILNTHSLEIFKETLHTFAECFLKDCFSAEAKE